MSVQRGGKGQPSILLRIWIISLVTVYDHQLDKLLLSIIRGVYRSLIVATHTP
jgi:hypothetical protein